MFMKPGVRKRSYGCHDVTSKTPNRMGVAPSCPKEAGL